MKVSRQVVVNFRLQLQGYAAGQGDRLGDVIRKIKAYIK